MPASTLELEMPITFEEVTAEIQGDTRGETRAEPSAPREKPAEDLPEQIERSLRLRDERLARLCAD
jgi:hypothetical protein